MPPPHRVLCRSEFSSTEAHSSALPPLAVPVSITRSGGRRERNTGCNVHGSPQNPAKAQQPYHMLGAAGCSCSCMHAYEPVAHHGRRQCPNSAPAGPTWPHVKQQHLDCKQVEGVLHHGEPCSKAPAAAAKHTEISKRSNGGRGRPCSALQGPQPGRPNSNYGSSGGGLGCIENTPAGRQRELCSNPPIHFWCRKTW